MKKTILWALVASLALFAIWSFKYKADDIVAGFNKNKHSQLQGQ